MEQDKQQDSLNPIVTSTLTTVVQSTPTRSPSVKTPIGIMEPSTHRAVMYIPVSVTSQSSPTSSGTTQLTPPPPVPVKAANRMNQTLQLNFQETDTQLKFALYHLSKQEPEKGAKILEKIRKQNKQK